MCFSSDKACTNLKDKLYSEFTNPHQHLNKQSPDKHHQHPLTPSLTQQPLKDNQRAPLPTIEEAGSPYTLTTRGGWACVTNHVIRLHSAFLIAIYFCGGSENTIFPMHNKGSDAV